MSSFQKFKLNLQHNKSQQSRISQNSIKNQSGIFTLAFSTHQIAFNYSDTDSVLVNADLMLSNMSEQNIYFKIRSSHPQFYQILPQQEILHPSASTRIVFKLRRDRLAVNPSERYANNLAKLQDKVNGNLFEVQWTVINEEQIKLNIIPQPKYSQTLKVIIKQYAIDPQTKKLTQPNFQRQSELRSQKDSSWKLSSRKQFLKDASYKDFQMNLQGGGDEQRQSLLRLPIIVVVAVVSFFVGYISA